MIDEHILELIHADVDGRLAPADRALLSRVLLADPEAHALHDELRRLDRALGDVPAREPPADLADSIMAALPADRPAAGQRATAGSWRRFLAVAAGVAAVVVALRIADVGHGVSGTDAVGTMASSRPPSSAPIDRPEVSGTLSLRRAGGALHVDLDLDLRADVEILASQDGVSAGVVAHAGADGDRRRLSIVLPDGGRGPVAVRVLSGGRILGAVELGAPAAP